MIGLRSFFHGGVGIERPFSNQLVAVLFAAARDSRNPAEDFQYPHYQRRRLELDNVRAAAKQLLLLNHEPSSRFQIE